METLATIANKIGVTVDNLYKLRDRHEDFPKPELHVSDRIKLYNNDAVVHWYREQIQPHPNSASEVKKRGQW